LRLAQAEAHLWRGEHAQAEERGTQASRELPPGSALWYRAVGHAVVAVAKQGRSEDLVRWVERALAAPAQHEAASAEVLCLAWAASYLMGAGRGAEADALMRRISEVLPALDDPDPQTLALVHQARAARSSLQGHPAACLASLEAALLAFEQAGDRRNVANVRANIGCVYADLGVWERAEAGLREALDAAERLGLAELEAIVQRNLGRVVAARGDLAQGERLLGQAIESFIRQGEPRLEGLARTHLAHVRLLAAAPEEAEAHATVAVRVLARVPAARAQARSVLARAALAQGKIEAALATAREAALALDAPGSLDEGEAEVRLTHAECLHAAGQTGEAAQVLAAACQRLQARAARIADVTLRRRFLADVPAHARTQALALTWTPT
jgi:tetratricopeptide (TPR) repeat protein